jgi:tRNA(Ile)-lysidine synthase
MTTRALAAARASGLVRAGEPLLVMLSGGADSVCLLDVAVRLDARVKTLHVNYGLRGAASDGDEAHCRALCERLGVELVVERVELEEGNLQAEARDARYALAEKHAAGDYAAAHTRSDQAETVLMRLASSPGRRGLLGMAPRRGRLVRPLLDVARADTEQHCLDVGLGWRTDCSNEDPRFTRARVRHELLPLLERVAPGAEGAIAETARLLRDEAAVLDAAVDAALTDDLETLARLPPALARLVLRRLADGPVARQRAEELLALAGRGGSVSLDIGGGRRAVVEYGRVSFTRAREAHEPAAVELAIPGSVVFGDWEVVAARGGGEGLDPSALGPAVKVRSWRAGDRIRAVGLGGGTKSLQDLFTDRKVPRSERGRVPVVEARGEVAWVGGLAVAERFRASPGADAVRFTATRRLLKGS